MVWDSLVAQDRRAKAEVAARREAAAAFPFIRPVLQQFNGKVYNRRFENALKEALKGNAPGYVYTYKGGFISVIYAPSVEGTERFTLCRMNAEKRLDGKTLDDSLKDCRAALLREAAEIEEQAQQAELFQKRIDEAERLLKSVTDGINETVRDIYGLNCYVDRY